MCYSAKIHSEYRKMVREIGPVMDIKAFAELWSRDDGKERDKIPKALLDILTPHLPDEAAAVMVARLAEDESAWQAKLFEQSKRKADNERKLATKPTKTAENEVRIAGNNIDQLKGWISDLHRTELKPRDWQFYPQWWAPVIVRDGDQYVIRPFRYQLRKPGLSADSDFVVDRKTKRKRLSGTYNARRDNLDRYWRNQFGHTHGLLIVDTFVENVEGPDGKNIRLEFKPRSGEPLLVACLWANWTDPEGKEPDLPCFAAITDDPEPEVAEAGHDRTIINIKPEHIEAWLNPDPKNLAAMYAIFDDKRHPYYEHRLAA